jgi:DNA-damage-inducible protein J
MGLTISGAFRLFLTRVAHDKALPFDPLVPSATTIEAMREARRGGLKSVNTVEELFTELNADD